LKISFPYLVSLELPRGSEQAWAINVANLFSQVGHELYLTNSPLEEGLIVDIMFLPERIDLWPDKTTWNFYKDHAKRFLFGVFNPRNSPFLNNIPNNGLLVTPYRACESECFV